VRLETEQRKLPALPIWGENSPEWGRDNLASCGLSDSSLFVASLYVLISPVCDFFFWLRCSGNHERKFRADGTPEVRALPFCNDHESDGAST